MLRAVKETHSEPRAFPRAGFSQRQDAHLAAALRQSDGTVVQPHPRREERVCKNSRSQVRGSASTNRHRLPETVKPLSHEAGHKARPYVSSELLPPNPEQASGKSMCFFSGVHNSIVPQDFTDHVSATLEKMASFLAVSASGFALDVALGRTNSQASAELRGVDTVQRDPVKIGVYEISGNRPMLCATRSLIYSKTQDVCQVLSSSFGVRYDACLGGGTGECTDTAAHSIFAISLGRAVTTMALPVTRFLRYHGVPFVLFGLHSLTRFDGVSVSGSKKFFSY